MKRSGEGVQRDVRVGLAWELARVVPRLALWLLVTLLVSIGLEWIGMTFWWEEQGAAHSQAMLERELGFVAQGLQQSVLSADPIRVVAVLTEVTHRTLFEVTGVIAAIHWLGEPQQPGESLLRVRLRRLYAPIAEYVLALILTVQVFVVRLTVLLFSMPVFGLSALAGLADGTTERDLRRFGGGDEGALVYHIAKRSLLWWLVLPWLIYLALPFSVHPNRVILPFAALFGTALWWWAFRLKKRL